MPTVAIYRTIKLWFNWPPAFCITLPGLGDVVRNHFQADGVAISLPASFRIVDLGFAMTWLNIESAPFNWDLEVAVISSKSTHVLEFPCRRIFGGGWLDAATRELVEVYPTHWRHWLELDARD